MMIKRFAYIPLFVMVITMSGVSLASAEPDLVITSLSAPTDVTLGEPFMASVTMKNKGNSDVVQPSNGSAVNYSVYISLDNNLDATDICAGYGGIFYQLLTARTSQTGEVLLQVNSENTPTGSYNLIAKADAICDLGNNVAESNEANNTSNDRDMVIVYESTAEIDLTMTDLVGPIVAERNVWLRLDTYITNLGPDSAPGRAASSCGHYTAFYLSEDTTITSSDIELSRICLNSIAGETTFRWWHDVKIPDSVPRGSYYWGVIADDTEILDETDETNNAFAATKRVQVR